MMPPTVPHRLPLTQLVTSIKARLEEDLSVDIFSFVPEAREKPYAEIGAINWTNSSWKNQLAKEVYVTFNAYSDDRNMQATNAVVSSMVRAMTRLPIMTLADDFAICDIGIDGSGEIVKEFDESAVYWRGTFRVRFKIREAQSSGPAV